MYLLRKEMLDEFQEYLYEEEKSGATIEKYIRDVKCFYGFAGEGRRISKGVVVEYKGYLIEKYQPVSVNSMLAALNCFFDYWRWETCKVKGIRIQRRVFCSEEKELTKKEYERLLVTAEQLKDKRLYYILQTVCSTGIRISELKYITIEGMRKGKLEVNCKGKYRKIFIPSSLRKELLKYAARENRKRGSVFVTRSGNVINRSNIWTQMKKLCEAAKVAKEKVFPHNLRHLFAATFYHMKKDLVKLADILGHTSVETTRIYTISTGKEHARQISSLGLVMI